MSFRHKVVKALWGQDLWISRLFLVVAFLGAAINFLSRPGYLKDALGEPYWVIWTILLVLGPLLIITADFLMWLGVKRIQDPELTGGGPKVLWSLHLTAGADTINSMVLWSYIIAVGSNDTVNPVFAPWVLGAVAAFFSIVVVTVDIPRILQASGVK